MYSKLLRFKAFLYRVCLYAKNSWVLILHIENYLITELQGGHGTGKTGNLAVNFSRQGKYREFSKFYFYTGKIVPTQGKF